MSAMLVVIIACFHTASAPCCLMRRTKLATGRFRDETGITAARSGLALLGERAQGRRSTFGPLCGCEICEEHRRSFPQVESGHSAASQKVFAPLDHPPRAFILDNNAAPTSAQPELRSIMVK